jgi:hypothetical protein
MKFLAMIACATVFAVAACAPAQTDASPLPSQISGAFLVEHKATVAVTEIPFKTWTKGNFTLAIEGLGGYNITNSNGALGGAMMLKFARSKNLELGIGLGTTIDIRTSQLQQLSFNNSGLIFDLTIKL